MERKVDRGCLRDWDDGTRSPSTKRHVLKIGSHVSIEMSWLYPKLQIGTLNENQLELCFYVFLLPFWTKMLFQFGENADDDVDCRTMLVFLLLGLNILSLINCITRGGGWVHVGKWYPNLKEEKQKIHVSKKETLASKLTNSQLSLEEWLTKERRITQDVHNQRIT